MNNSARAINLIKAMMYDSSRVTSSTIEEWLKEQDISLSLSQLQSDLEIHLMYKGLMKVKI